MTQQEVLKENVNWLASIIYLKNSQILLIFGIFGYFLKSNNSQIPLFSAIVGYLFGNLKGQFFPGRTAYFLCRLHKSKGNGINGWTHAFRTVGATTTAGR
jgi:hypothetical protein